MDHDLLPLLTWLHKAPRAYAYPLSVLWVAHGNALPHGPDVQIMNTLWDQTVEAAKVASKSTGPTPFDALVKEIDTLPPNSPRFNKAVGKSAKLLAEIGCEHRPHPTTSQLIKLHTKRWKRQTDNYAVENV